MSYIRVEDLKKEYGKGEAAFMAVKGMRFHVRQGEFVAIVGESGSGKSTLLSMMGALNTPTRGRYVVDDIDVYSLGLDQRAKFRMEFLGFIFQSFHLIPYLNVMENVMLPLAIKKKKSHEKREMARVALKHVGLSDKKNRLPSEISGGEQERVAIARAVVNNPTILLADEPTGNLDTKNSREIMNLFHKLNGEGITIVMVTHNSDCAREAERTLCVSDGLIEEQERSQKIVEYPFGVKTTLEAYPAENVAVR
ncbi:MAG: ABC transporter ATP-binding protein [Deltaproteobacteria bacterium]|nr:ABC transporter ATP-binding protein [Deltaproteobacteria bacterium]